MHCSEKELALKRSEELIQFSEKDKIYVIPFNGNNLNTYSSTGADTKDAGGAGSGSGQQNQNGGSG